MERRDEAGVETTAIAELVSVEGKRVLDVGCGEGRLTTFAAERAAYVYAFDPNRIVTPRGQVEHELNGRAALVVAAENGQSFSGGISWQARCTKKGTGRADRMRHGPGSSRVCGLAVDDVIVGGRGRDRIFAQEGNDSIDARDHGFDVVGCGAGLDRVAADQEDLVGVDCERVHRR